MARVEMRGVHKRFGGVHAVAGIDLRLDPGEIVGLLGHNGAGKSTLLRALSGADPLDEGEIRVDGVPVAIRTPRDAQRLGIETLHQHLALVDELDAVANVFLGRELRNRFGLLDEEAMEAATRAVLVRLSPAFAALRTPVRRLSGGQRAAVAIARAIHFQARVLILDEPTAALGPQEKRLVADVVRQLRREGLAILVISHDLYDVLDVADRVVVMRAGRIAGGGPAGSLTHDELVGLIVGGATPSG
jgi:D-xylose transport system ATP-binding protein